ncbi:hypothetical protein VRRI112168_03190 [Vreelandella rituensis]|uniref:Uncharacterized protein n=1 Tax=Vreelandella rituensis TaxID=2282306 RepID=A0A368UBM4_9GAMM|nr:hypothetical protein [Halomonas rituensis]RCV92763.1 hypothetical protein DU506_06095 [Halomonas rituensis]
MSHINRDPRNNAAWQAASQWRARTRRTRPNGIMDSLKLLLIWLVLGALMIVGVILGLFFLLVGWAMMPLVRYRLKKRLEQMRANQAEDITSEYETSTYETSTYYANRSGSQDVLEGSYEVKDNPKDSSR